MFEPVTHLMANSPITAAQVRAHLQFILNSAEFEKCRRIGEFLSFIVEETLAGRGDRLKEHTIAQAVFHKDETFDPKISSIVRVEAGRLRSRLASFYRKSGAATKIRLEVPKGNYSVVILSADPPSSQARDPRLEQFRVNRAPDIGLELPSPGKGARAIPGIAWSAGIIFCCLLIFGLVAQHDKFAALWGPDPSPVTKADDQTITVAVIPLHPINQSPHATQLATALSHEIVTGLTQFKDLSVLPGSLTMPQGGDGSSQNLQRDAQSDYLLDGSLRRDGDAIRVTLQLLDQVSGVSLWAESYDMVLPDAESLAHQRQIAATVAGTLAGPGGVMVRSKIQSLAAKEPDALTPHDCLMRFYAYRNQGDAKRHRQARQCLSRSLAGATGNSNGWAAMALVHLDEHRFGYNSGTQQDPALDRALEAAEQSVASDPENARAYLAQAAVHFYRDEFDAFFAAAKRARGLNPNDSDLLAEVGLYLSLSGRWVSGAVLLQQAKSLNPNHPSWYNFAEILNSYRQGDFDTAVSLARELNASGWYWTHAVRAMACGKIGDTKGSDLSKQKLLALKPDFAKNVHAEFARLGVRSDTLIAEFAEGLRLAGLELPRAQPSHRDAPSL